MPRDTKGILPRYKTHQVIFTPSFFRRGDYKPDQADTWEFQLNLRKKNILNNYSIMTLYASLSNHDREPSLSVHQDADQLNDNNPKIGKGKLLKQAAEAVKSRVGVNAIGPSPMNRSIDELSMPFARSFEVVDIEGGGSSGVADPYFAVRDDLLRQVSQAEESLTAYVDVVENTDSAANMYQVKELKKVYKRHMKQAESTLKDLLSTITMVETHRDQFSQLIPDQELHKRKLFVNDIQGRIRLLREDFHSDRLRQKILQDERSLMDRRNADRKAKDNNQTNGSMSSRESQSSLLGTKTRDEEVAEIHHLQAEQMLRQQDETLDHLDHAVVRVGQMANNIHEELKTQNKMLTELSEDLSDAEEKLGMVMGKLAKLLKTKSKCQLGTILILSVTMIILFFLVIYT